MVWQNPCLCGIFTVAGEPITCGGQEIMLPFQIMKKKTGWRVGSDCAYVVGVAPLDEVVHGISAGKQLSKAGEWAFWTQRSASAKALGWLEHGGRGGVKGYAEAWQSWWDRGSFKRQAGSWGLFQVQWEISRRLQQRGGFVVFVFLKDTTQNMAHASEWLNGCEFEQTLRDSEGQGSLVCCSPWGYKSWTLWLRD